MLRNCIKNKYITSDCKNCAYGNVCKETDKKEIKDFFTKVKESLDKVK